MGVGLILVFAVLNFLANVRSSHPTHKTFGDFTDHFSHASAAILFTSVGFRIFSEKIETACEIRKSDDITAFINKYQIADYDQKHVCQANPGGRVLFINGSDGPRPYPIGPLIYVAPAAALYYLTGDFELMNWLLIFQFFLFNTVFLSLLFLRKDRFFSNSLEVDSYVYLPLIMMVAGLVYESSIGIYDGISLFFLCMSLMYFDRREDKNSFSKFLFLFSVSLFFNYRTLYWSPILAIASIREALKGTKHIQGIWLKNRFLVTASAFLLSTSGMTFFLSLGIIRAFSSLNPLNTHFQEVIGPLFLVGFGAVVSLFVARAWEVLAVLICAMAFTYHMPFLRTWHFIYFFPLLFLILRRPKEHRGILFASVLLFLIHLDFSLFRTGVFFTAPLSIHLLDMFR